MLSRYKILGKLGAGGMGVVYRAEDSTLRRPVALKVITGALHEDEHARARFLREARIAAGLNHPNVCAIHDFGEVEPGEEEALGSGERLRAGTPFISMELVEGETLAQRIAKKPLPVKDAVEICLQIAEGLESAHERGIVHRDLKPANVKITPDGKVKILDFGLAQTRYHEAVGTDTTVSQTFTDQLTRPGVVVGTVAYMSPEQARGDTVDHRSDVWSLGVVLYEMVSGRRPFAGEHPAAVAYSIQHTEPAAVTGLRTGLPVELERIVNKCLSKEAAERYQHADDLVVDLRRLRAVASQETRTLAVAGPERARRSARLRIAGAGIPLAILAGVIVVSLRGPRSVPAAPSAIQSLAVLPFANLSGDAGQDYFVEGMHEALITDLSRASGLRVISRTSVMRYKGANAPLPSIARELKVDGIVEGSILRAANRVRIAAHLVEARSDRQLWAQSYERDMGEILQLQREVAKEIVMGIGAVLRPVSSHRGSATPNVERAAYEAYARGRYHWNKRTRADMLEAIAQFRRAIEIAPTFAEAHAGLADVYGVAGVNNDFQPEECYPLARAEAERALALNDELAQAYVSLAFVQLYFDWDRAAAGASYRRALELDPNSAVARQWYAIYLEQEGRFEESLAEIESARMLDPMSPIMNANVARRYAMARRFDRAVAAIDQALQLDPGLPFARSVQEEIYFMQGDYRKAAELAFGPGSAPNEGGSAGGPLLAALEKEGPKGYLAARLRVVRQNEPLAGKHEGLLVASCLAHLGRTDEAFANIEGWMKERRSWVQWLKAYPTLEPLRSDRRYTVFLAKAGLTP